ncbi:MAG: exodeoxyribonuclease VII small subunit [Marinomonas sp.]|jgi:exodeoxyribonuclease VII small subunit|uniref:Exodeoxyribonuclease 7 small subunit n=1 Tax=Marinomonas communis TaxID=28254 RepID=A0A4R6X3R1_9GAMM|nr:exodeoxyribonuclease VII small subunit [Marinomonas communis]MAF14431.1 exodeoxyribonuclease VII small subunit [Marinomonas sp.]MEC8082866.1 exodeoxyribonuclease VII small subunit [Pseudomonadota bacterium]MCC4273363.1 exodeoxyribonuclease VII small subunit [Marinomonas communis]MEC8482782.1 exodeoxyribonuclease VII small subunit [Pseudomonadota bacterium]RUM55343.1 MAG: exodeoxyribonuclease VII small subunit [Marinomonas sp.]|tara:strand:+ start:544 stop:786 length:243 start_codon:yes stop_codon:yes gene_type:complete
MSRKTSVRHFEENLSELETIVAQLESNQLSLEDALKAFEKGVKLSQDCQSVLTQAEQKVQILLEKHDGERLETFDPESEQ